MFSHYTQHRVQRNLLYGESFSASPAHGTEAMPGQRSADGPAPPLDPIDASVVRRVRLGLIISFITVFELCVLSNLLQILDPSRPAPPWEEPFRKRRPARKDTEIPVAGARFSGQFNSLLPARRGRPPGRFWHPQKPAPDQPRAGAGGAVGRANELY